MTPVGISRDVVLNEIQTTTVVLKRWEEVFENGIPSVDREGTELDLQRTLHLFYGEMIHLSTKLHSLANRYCRTEE